MAIRKVKLDPAELLERRAARVARLIELNAPPLVVVNEVALVGQAADQYREQHRAEIEAMAAAWEVPPAIAVPKPILDLLLTVIDCAFLLNRRGDWPESASERATLIGDMVRSGLSVAGIDPAEASAGAAPEGTG